MSAMASQITGVSIVGSTVSSGSNQRKHRSSVLLAFVRGFHRWSVISPHKTPVTRKMFPFDDVIMIYFIWCWVIPRIIMIIVDNDFCPIVLTKQLITNHTVTVTSCSFCDCKLAKKNFFVLYGTNINLTKWKEIWGTLSQYNKHETKLWQVWFISSYWVDKKLDPLSYVRT